MQIRNFLKYFEALPISPLVIHLVQLLLSQGLHLLQVF